MLKKAASYYLLRWCLLLLCNTIFSQTEIYKSDFAFDDFKSDRLAGSITISGKNILFKAFNDKVYSIDKKEGKTNWEINGGTKSDAAPYLYNNTFFYGNSRTAQFDLATGKKIKELPFESLTTKPCFLNNIMYCTALADGGMLVAYNLDENKIIWQKNIGFGTEVQPVYLKDKIIANAQDDNWFEIDYDGNLLKTKSKKYIYLDTTQFFIKNYKFLTHDGKEITQDFLKKNKLSNSDYQTNQANTFILNDKQLLVLGDNKTKILQLNLQKEFPTDDFDQDAYSGILALQPESVWFCFQNFLIHYDFKNNNRLRKVNLSKWNPHQILLENRTIWLISKNDGQLYGLDFEPDQKTADEIAAKTRMDFERYGCDVPDQKKIEATKKAQEKFKNNK
nr:PQQ-binding-like beta-propeller repeat protein [uncultured Flavobacterium sp.]